MQKLPLYMHLSRLVVAMKNCDKSGNNDWKDKHADKFASLVNKLPSGSGLDLGVNFCADESSANRLVFSCDFHHMDEHGLYDGWTRHKCIITPSLAFGVDIRITGRNRNQIKDYLADTLHYPFTQEIEV